MILSEDKRIVDWPRLEKFEKNSKYFELDLEHAPLVWTKRLSVGED